MPDLTAVPGAFEPGKDPCAAYADAVIASLEGDVFGGKVIHRGSCVTTVRAWRANQKALEKALAAGSGVTQAEVNAFLNAQNRVTSHVKQYMDAGDWFWDSSILPDVRVSVDGAGAERSLKSLNAVAAIPVAHAASMGPPPFRGGNSAIGLVLWG